MKSHSLRGLIGSALLISFLVPGVDAQSITDRPTRDGERQYCTGLDIWRTRADATKQSSACAPIVISWIEVTKR